jgi:ribosomal protein S18 acetylase RimI-like enzyme
LNKNNILIRDIRPEEFDAMAQLLKAAYQQYEKFMPADAWQFYLSDIMDVRGRMAESELIVAEVNRKLAGTVTLYLEGRNRTEGNWPGGWAGARLLGVGPEYRDKGIGRALMDECIRRCRESGIRTIGLHTLPFMEVAKNMYDRMGFQCIPEFDLHPMADVVIIAYKLDV